MKRLLNQELMGWSNSVGRQPLILRGARQTGKTYLVDDFGRTHFKHYLKINLERDRQYLACFDTLDPKAILHSIEVLANQRLPLGESLLFIDEIQECPQAIQALRYFYEELPELHVIGAGSLLEFALTAEDFSMPVGRVSFLHLYPMSFSEVLLALGKDQLVTYLNEVTVGQSIPDAIHQQLLGLLDLYFILGGMPQVVNLYAEHKDLLRCRQAQTAILNSYRDDFGKYATQVQKQYCERVFGKSFDLIAKHFKYTDIDPDMDYRGIKQAIQLLFKANILTPIYYSKATGFPLLATQVEKKYKLLFLDVGLVQAAGRVPPDRLLLQDSVQLNQGALVEQYVGQHLLGIQPSDDRAELFYWQRDARGSQAEVDYIFPVDDELVPLEVKSGKTGRLKSLRLYLEGHDARHGVKLSTDAFDTTGDIWSVPLYLIEQLPRLILSYI